MSKEVVFELFQGKNLLFTGTREECAEFLGISVNTIKWYATAKHKEIVKKSKRSDELYWCRNTFTPLEEREYALYKGEELIADGTIEEIHEATGIPIRNLKFMTYPAYHERSKNAIDRKIMVRLDEVDEDGAI